jgi:hypothetical protein
MVNLSQCLASLGRLPEALDLAQQAVDMAAHVLPDGHPTRKKCDAGLAAIRKKIENGGDGSKPDPVGGGKSVPPTGG